MHFRFVQRAQQRELIARLRDVFDDCNIDATPMVFDCFSYITVSVARRSDDAYHVVASIAYKTLIDLVITRTRVENPLEPGVEVPLATQVMYLRKLVGFFWGQADLADLVDDLERTQRATAASSKLTTHP